MRLVGILAFGLAGCSIVFNTNDLPRIADAPVDATPPSADARIFDANPAGLTLDSLDPATIDEGTGTSGGRPAVIAIKGANLDPTAMIEIVDGADPVPTGLAIGTHVVGVEHNYAAITVTVPVIGALTDGQSLSLNVKVTNPGGTAKMLPLTIKGLDPFTSTGNVAVSSLKAKYSDATIAANVHFTGTAPAHLRFSGGVTISAAIDADADNMKTPLAGPGGCDGGTGSSAAGCGAGKGGGGNSGLSGAAGGGAGFGAPGSPGTGASGNGMGGAKTGDDMITKLDYNAGEEGNRGNGGGGGGGATLGTAGKGGGGGGTIELTAGGTITVTGGGATRSKGGDGTLGGGVGGGDAGGGSGGAIVIRSGAGVSASGAWITAPAGGNSGGKGGAGAIGRIRVDSPTGGVASMGNPTAQQGASWPVDAPTIVTTPTVSLSLIGGNGGTYGYFVVDGQAEMTKTLSGTTMSNVSVALTAGLNRVCAEAAPGASGDVAIECIDVAYVP